MHERLREADPDYRKFALAMLMAGLSAFAIFYCVQPLLPIFARIFGIDAQESSLAISLTIGPMALMLPLAGVLSDRVGRRRLILVSLFAAGACTLAGAIASSWPVFLALRLLAGLLLAGVPSVAMTYIAEEVEEAAVSRAMGVYISGTAMGGMAGRLIGGVVAEAGGWRIAVGSIGVLVLVQAGLFARFTRGRTSSAHRTHGRPGQRTAVRQLLSDPTMLLLFVEALLLMGAFVSLYNYIGFRLHAPPYGLGHAVIGAIFLLFIIGSYSSALAGRLSASLGPRRTLLLCLTIFLSGICLTLAAALPLIILAMGALTAGFFGAHSVASSWVAQRGGAARTQASALYLCSYYLGGSLLGSAGGFTWSSHGWPAVAGYAGGLITLALAAACFTRQNQFRKQAPGG
jgi:YNFM family putative membrane transporter